MIESRQRSKHSVKEFKDKLGQRARRLSIEDESRPLIIIIDELDRCRPSYAIELLETAKHIFNVENVIFVLSTNRRQLARAFEGIYGEKFDGSGYLERFFDIDFRLPDVSRTNFIERTLDDTLTSKLLEEKYGREAFVSLMDHSTLTVRNISKAVHHLGLVMASMDAKVKLQPEVASMLILLRAVNRDSFQNFIDGRLTDQQTVQNLFSGMKDQSLQNLEAGLVYQTILEGANASLLGVQDINVRSRVNAILSKQSYALDGAFGQQLQDYLRALSNGSFGSRIDLEVLIRRIELLSGDSDPTP